MSRSERLPEWKKWCTRGKHAGPTKRKAVENCPKNSKNQLVGYYSDLLLKPDLDYKKSLYPSVEHLGDKNDKENVTIETRIVNDMKSHLNEKEFWELISHLFFVGVQKNKINAILSGKRVSNKWKPNRNYEKQK
jgi:hypothetical protein